MIQRFASLTKSKEKFIQKVETQTTLLHKKAGTYKVEHSINNEIVSREDLNTTSFTGHPAPVYLQDDPWFGPAPELIEKQQDYMEKETEIKMLEEQHPSEVTCESYDIHAKIYEIATKNWTTVSETQGGSENFHEGPGGWNSGTGMGQFK